MALLRSAESRVPTKCVPEELKQSAAPKREMWERDDGVVVVTDSEQFAGGKIGESNKTVSG